MLVQIFYFILCPVSPLCTILLTIVINKYNLGFNVWEKLKLKWNNCCLLILARLLLPIIYLFDRYSIESQWPLNDATLNDLKASILLKIKI